MKCNEIFQASRVGTPRPNLYRNWGGEDGEFSGSKWKISECFPRPNHDRTGAEARQLRQVRQVRRGEWWFVGGSADFLAVP